MPTRDCRNVRSRCHRFCKHCELLLNTEPSAPLHAPQQLGRRIRHRSCAIASSSSKPASGTLILPIARRPSPQGYDASDQERKPVWGDQAYRGRRGVIRQHAPKTRDFINRSLPPARCKKNTHRLLVTCALANLFIVRRHLLRVLRRDGTARGWRDRAWDRLRSPKMPLSEAKVFSDEPELDTPPLR